MSKKISEVTLASSINGTDKIPISQGSGEAVTTNVNQVKEFIEKDAANEIKTKDGISEGKTVQADLTQLALQVSSKYEKPSGGIPSTDLASSVQTSISRADEIYNDYIATQDIM